MIPEIGDFICLPQESNSRALIHNKNGYEIISNICRHRQSPMLRDKGNVSSIVCPLHCWTYDITGKLIGAPNFKSLPNLNLKTKKTFEWEGLLFENDVSKLKYSLSRNPFFDYFTFDNFALHNVTSQICNYNWKTFVEVYLDDYHVDSFHSGLGGFVDCNKLQWHFFDDYSIQAVGYLNEVKRTSSIYSDWTSLVRSQYVKEKPKWGAIWMLIYPNIMLEWYPQTLVISILYPISPEKTLNVTEFYYPEQICHFHETYAKAQQLAYKETAEEDDKIAILIEEGRKSIKCSNEKSFGPIHPRLEAGIPHFYKFLKSSSSRKLKKHFYDSNNFN